MNPTAIRWLLRAYPPAWRERYAEELEELLRASPRKVSTIVDVLCSGFRERLSPPPTARLIMNNPPDSVLALAKQPSAFLPMAMSVVALAVVLGSLTMYGIQRHVDEGATAHTWQLLMAGQTPVIAWFAFRWLRKAPRLTLGVLGLQFAISAIQFGGKSE